MNRKFWIVLAVIGLVAAMLGAAYLFLSADRAKDGDWPLHGRTEDGQRFSPLDQIDKASVKRLGLAWSYDLGTEAGQEATPIMVDGILYIASAYDVVHAVDARSGKALWSFDPEVKAAAARSCCGPVSRGVAVEAGRVFLGALDGRLIALDARTGKLLWQVQTLDQVHPAPINYTITGAPRVVKGRVIIGNGGAEFGARGYVSAYDAATGRRDWRFYTVPGKPGTKDNEASDDALAKVQNTWAGDYWRWGGGGTVWDAIAYDPDLNLIYIGTGNGSPTNHGQRSNGRGDNLFVSSIVALNPDTGKYVWHYQQTPGETWDYTSTQNMIFADLEIAGQTRKVLMQAPKNGFFYVLDRATGEFISGDPFVKVTWASRIDAKTGRPVEMPGARYYRDGAAFVSPSSGGAHNWPPMAFSPDTGLVYIPAQDMGLPFEADADPDPKAGVYNTGTSMKGGSAMPPADLKNIFASMKGYLIAWDPRASKIAWRREMEAPFNGGILATAGGLIFEGNTSRTLVAYDANDGKTLWTFNAQVAISAPPISYALDGEQYVAVLAGYGGGWPMLGGQLALKAGPGVWPNRLLVFKLDGKAKLPSVTPRQQLPLDPPEDNAPAALIAKGDGLYGRYCLRCHGAAAVSASFVPDLRRSPYLHDGLEAIVLNGALEDLGMPRFDTVLNSADVRAVRAYLIRRANEDKQSAEQ